MGKRAVNRIRAAIALLLILAGALYLFAVLRLYPMIEKVAAVNVDNDAAGAINRAIDAVIDEGKISYDRLILLEKDENGNITALQTNMAEANRLKTEVLAEIGKEISDLSVEQLSIPLGSVLFPELLSGSGPMITVRVLAVRTSYARFVNRFSAAGINQTLHQIVMHVGITVTVALPSGTMDVPVISDIVVAETVIVGSVPETFVNLR
ncbi:MAG: sporulation protein YunB [Clostridia bacterium]|nr:sporulation protein YunB [Clostridia bacterium]